MEIDVDRALEIAIAVPRISKSEESLYLSALSLSETEFVFSPQFLPLLTIRTQKAMVTLRWVWRVNFPSQLLRTGGGSVPT